MRALRTGVLLALIGIWPAVAKAAPITVDFEGLTDSEFLTTELPGLTFEGAVVLTAGISLNEIDFPPHSGSQVVTNDGGLLGIGFATPVAQVGGYFTYISPVMLTAFDKDNVPLASTTSSRSSNLGTPNEWIAIALTESDISRVVITGDDAGSSFTLDDLTYDAEAAAVPEPATGVLLLIGAAALIKRSRTI